MVKWLNGWMVEWLNGWMSTMQDRRALAVGERFQYTF
ncbi:MAG: ribosome modulation factor [Halioglobus sp.]|jgi:ribosome modulation factor